MFDDRGESGGLDTKTDRHDLGRTEVDGKVIAESPESVLLNHGVLTSAKNVYSIEGSGWSTSGGISSVRCMRNTRLVEKVRDAHHRHHLPCHRIRHRAHTLDT
jgi:hypothetical protein